MIWEKAPNLGLSCPQGLSNFSKNPARRELFPSSPIPTHQSDAPGEGGGPWATKLSDIDERVVKIRGLWNTEPALAKPTGGRPWATKIERY